MTAVFADLALRATLVARRGERELVGDERATDGTGALASALEMG